MLFYDLLCDVRVFIVCYKLNFLEIVVRLGFWFEEFSLFMSLVDVYYLL